MPHITSLNLALARSFHCSRILSSGGLFRARRRLPPSNNEWGPLTDRPDFSVIGKPDPRFTSEGQRRRAIKNYQFAWMIAVQTVGGSHIPIKPKVGQHFVITTDWGFLGTIDQDVHVIKADGKRNFAYDVENWIGTHVEAHVDQLGEKQCKVRLTVSSRVKNPLQKYLIHPFARLYYSNWLTHSLLNFQLRYS
ncbi:hypothetical protein CRM22_006972 [Opisthorchis felineus]|uniref:Uncharacterized protein n=1 Tax=Opisthorchis felineus TaxID=147828 RepID=A0A4S2LIG0_OPIFE|nr:hypothetical protein CRM22_006972 [Opisthorchis felineus]